MKFSPVTLVLVGGLGFVLGTVMHQQRPQVALAQTPAPAPPANDGKLRIIVFGAHPDDAEYCGAGVAMKWAKQGHHVKFGIGHQRRYRPLGNGRRSAGAAAKEGGARPSPSASASPPR